MHEKVFSYDGKQYTISYDENGKIEEVLKKKRRIQFDKLAPILRKYILDTIQIQLYLSR